MPVKVLVVDDSAFMRKMVSDMIQSDPRLEVVATARDGLVALEKLKQLDVDVITLDVQMPRMDGLAFLKQLMEERPLPVVMLSSLTSEGSQTTLDALALGAVDFVPKPSGAISLDIETVKDQLLRKVRAAARAKVRPGRLFPAGAGLPASDAGEASRAGQASGRPSPDEVPTPDGATRSGTDAGSRTRAVPRNRFPRSPGSQAPPRFTGRPTVSGRGPHSTQAPTQEAGERTVARGRYGAGQGTAARPGSGVTGTTASGKTVYPGTTERPPKVPLGRTPRVLLALGASTGGPAALEYVLCHLSPDVRAGIVITQHMPPGFTRSYAARLDSRTPFTVREAEHGDDLQEGLVLIAPGDYHMVITPSKRISLNQDPPVQYVRPSVDVMMRSVAAVYGKRAIGAILTGMGRDGAQGMAAIKEAQGRTVVQDEATSVIFSMPSAAIAQGAADEILPLQDIAGRLAHHWRELENSR